MKNFLICFALACALAACADEQPTVVNAPIGSSVVVPRDGGQPYVVPQGTEGKVAR